MRIHMHLETLFLQFTHLTMHVGKLNGIVQFLVALRPSKELFYRVRNACLFQQGGKRIKWDQSGKVNIYAKNPTCLKRESSAKTHTISCGYIFHNRGMINMTTQVRPYATNNFRSVFEHLLVGCIASFDSCCFWPHQCKQNKF